jgi:hypothetical protein
MKTPMATTGQDLEPEWKALPKDGPMGPLEVADFMGPWDDDLQRPVGVKRATVQQWLFRKVLPDRDFTVSGFPAWKKETIVKWALATHRFPADDPRAQ